MKIIKMPCEIKLTHMGKPLVHQDGSPVLIEFLDLTQFLLENDARFHTPRANVRKADRIEAAVLESTDGIVKLHDDDWKLLNEVALEPQCGMPILHGNKPIGRQLGIFVDAIEAAESEKTETKTAAAQN